MFWLRNKKNSFQSHTLIWGPVQPKERWAYCFLCDPHRHRRSRMLWRRHDAFFRAIYFMDLTTDLSQILMNITLQQTKTLFDFGDHGLIFKITADRFERMWLGTSVLF